MVITKHGGNTNSLKPYMFVFINSSGVMNMTMVVVTFFECLVDSWPCLNTFLYYVLICQNKSMKYTLFLLSLL